MLVLAEFYVFILSTVKNKKTMYLNPVGFGKGFNFFSLVQRKFFLLGEDLHIY